MTRRVLADNASAAFISVNGLTLGRLAARLDGLVARDVLLPAGRAQEKVRLKMKEVSFANVIQVLGFRTQKRQARQPRRKRRAQ
jgi:hypothetical protein